MKKIDATLLDCSICLTSVFIILSMPCNAAAHLVTTGLGPVYDGVGHLVMTPEDIIPALAIALLAGQRGVFFGRHAMFILPCIWFLGGLLGITIGNLPGWPVSAISFLLLGGLIAADKKLSQEWFYIVIIGVGLVHGILNGIALKEGPGVMGLIGIMVALFAVVTLVAAFTVSLKKSWSRIVVRVAGSWVAAIGILMFGWAFQGLN